MNADTTRKYAIFFLLVAVAHCGLSKDETTHTDAHQASSTLNIHVILYSTPLNAPMFFTAASCHKLPPPPPHPPPHPYFSLPAEPLFSLSPPQPCASFPLSLALVCLYQPQPCNKSLLEAEIKYFLRSKNKNTPSRHVTSRAASPITPLNSSSSRSPLSLYLPTFLSSPVNLTPNPPLHQQHSPNTHPYLYFFTTHGLV